MTKIVKTINIKAPVEKVYDYISEPTNLPEIWPSLVEIKDVQKLPSGGTKERWVYKMAGLRLEGTSESVDTIRPAHRQQVQGWRREHPNMGVPTRGWWDKGDLRGRIHRAHPGSRQAGRGHHCQDERARRRVDPG